MTRPTAHKCSCINVNNGYHCDGKYELQIITDYGFYIMIKIISMNIDKVAIYSDRCAKRHEIQHTNNTMNIICYHYFIKKQQMPMQNERLGYYIDICLFTQVMTVGGAFIKGNYAHYLNQR